MWVWVDDWVTEEEDLGGGGKSLFLQLEFCVEVTDLSEDGDESQDEEEEGFFWLMGFGVMVVAVWW